MKRAAVVVQFPLVTSPVAAERRLGYGEDPAARLRRHGADTLSDTELVALLTRSHVRTEADLQPARALLRDGLAPLLRRVTAGAADIPRRDATRLAAAFELARRAIAPRAEPLEHFQPTVIGPRLASRYALDPQERLGALFLDTRGRIITERGVFVGTLHSAIVSTRDVLQLALGLHAKAVVVFHNHPSGDPQPSDEDVAYTRRLASAAKLLDIDLVDHLVLGRRRYLSMKARGDF
ncbi:MAG: hypothetical protein M3P06_01970 [Acidobacteriota bacterium]|nr:hypothetical protein [Acidobacteriota bacterium]